jgi:hypothetical protein
MPEDRALALLENPDLLNADVPPEQLHLRLPTECTSPDLVFTTSWKQGYILSSQWLGRGADRHHARGVLGSAVAAAANALLHAGSTGGDSDCHLVVPDVPLLDGSHCDEDSPRSAVRTGAARADRLDVWHAN